MTKTPTDKELMDPGSWDFDAAMVATPSKSPGAVVSVRFTKEDLTAVSEAALERGMKTSEFIRSAAIEKASREGARPVIALSAAADRNVKPAQLSNWRRTHGTGRFRIVQKLVGGGLPGQTS